MVIHGEKAEELSSESDRHLSSAN